jgi:SAM-dependent MidA family methyltransferase
MPLDTPLAQLIADQIRESGPISFRDFVEWALYHPELGYYNRSAANLGKEGDFYTSPQVGAVFGWTLGRAIEKVASARKLPEPSPGKKASLRYPAPAVFSIVEFGAGKGFLAHDVLEYFQYQNPSLLEQIQYSIVEQSPALRRFQDKLLHQSPALRKHVRWISADELEPFSGVVLANEFVDALPFHRIVLTKKGFREIFVDLEGNDFIEILAPLSSERLQPLVDEVAEENQHAQGEPWLVGQTIEVSMDAVDWLISMGRLQLEGSIFIFDYGDEIGNLYFSTKKKGTARAFYRHQLSDRFFDHIGEQDITASVDFTLLRRTAESRGFECEKLLSQSDFLMRHEIPGVVEDRERLLGLTGEGARRARLQVLHLILPEMMGTRFKVLELKRKP